ncbi:MAG TPA: FeoA family protein [Steroidobacteraceae bacterium]|nr:FeoA family protein [Steroidobacteraceae bacterium]
MPTDRPTAAAEETLGLQDLPPHTDARIVAVEAHNGRETADLAERLAEIGFLPGERVRLLARGPFGEPLAVRVGSDTFALRRGEAACVRVVAIGPAGDGRP